MIILKFLNLIMILLICSYLGVYKARSFESRVKELNKFQNALSMLKTKIEFTYEPLKNIFEDISRIIYESNENVFINTVNNKKDFYTSWQNAILNIKNGLNKEDKDIIKMLGKMLGKTDVKGQVSEIELTMSLIEMQIRKAENERDKNVKLYKTLGIVLGLGICIILI